MRVLHPSSNNILAWPEDWLIRYHNGINEPCDMLIGPCVCGAWHHADEWSDPKHPCSRTIGNVPVFEFYKAVLGNNRPRVPSRLTLSFF